MTTLVRKTGLSERTVHRAIAKLINIGELEVQYNAGPGLCNLYRVRHTPVNVTPPSERHPRLSDTPASLTGVSERHPTPVREAPLPPSERHPEPSLEPSVNPQELQTVVEQARPLSVIPGGFSDDPADILDVWDAWKASTGKQRCDFSPTRRQAIVKALNRYPLADVLDAVQGWVHDPWPERPQHIDITQLLHMGSKGKPHNTLEKMRDLWRDGPPRQVSKTTAQAMRTSVAMRARRQAQAQAEEVNHGADRGRLGGLGGPAQRGLPAPAD